MHKLFVPKMSRHIMPYIYNGKTLTFLMSF